MLKQTDILLELMTDIEMYVMIKNNIRGGLYTTGSIRSAEANNPYMKQEYNPTKTNSYIISFDANNFYGYAMSRPLPSGQYECINPSNITFGFIKNMISKHVKVDIF